MQITTGPTCSRIRHPERDPILGRWVAQTMVLADGTKCKIYTCYRVNESSPGTAGPYTVYKQQWNVGMQNDINFEPRSQFLTNLINEIRKQRDDNYKILLMGDFNTEIFHANIAQHMEQCDLIDLHEPFMDPRSTTTPNTWFRGSHKIDHIFGTDIFLHAMRQGAMILHTDHNIADHRILIRDLCQSKLNAVNKDLTNPDQRILNSKSPTKVSNYIKILETKMDETKIDERLYKLCRRASQPNYTLTERDELKYCRINQQMTELMQYAEKQCGSKNYGYYYSKALERAGRMISSLKQRRRTIVITELNTAGTAAEKATAREHLTQINDELREAWANLKLAQKQSREHRNRHLETCAEAAAAERNTDIKTLRQEMLKHEKHSRAWARIKRHINADSGGQLDHILLPEDNMREVRDPTELHEILVNQSIINMSLPEGSPFTVPPLDSVIPPWSPSPVNDEILNGTYTPPNGSSRNIKDLFQKLEMDHNIDTPTDILQVEITTEQFKNAVKIRPERTSSSPSGRHIGHYKAALKSQRLLDFHTTIINFA